MPLAIFHDADDGSTSTKSDLATQETTHMRALRHVITSIRDGSDTESAGERGIVTMQIIEAIYESARQGGQTVRVGYVPPPARKPAARYH